MQDATKHYINGQWVASIDGREMAVENPSTEERLPQSLWVASLMPTRPSPQPRQPFPAGRQQTLWNGSPHWSG